MSKNKMSSQSKLIWVLLLIGLAAMEFPGVFFFKDKVDPFILGMPFIYGYIVCWWAYMSAVLLYAYKTRWGQPKGEGGDE
jgi:hypothetical protein